MHLKQLKLAGFKSFVDPTIVPFPSQLVAVVGPNGCGKSNVIDAVRWVMGESSAKNLRGESMVDVIFNGSTTRKAIGQASVELIFDNSLGRLTGQYASYQEISVKRLVTRDGESAYFLNGTRCRRRDITDIFLGTGAGARGYSIIGQGTISRIVEARPEEIRAYLEEAAGISKYKERRRETLSRIQQTRDNLVRVADIREELDKQIQRLERQARSAQCYQELKEEEHICKAEILALKWRALNDEQIAITAAVSQGTLSYEEHQSKTTDAYQQSIQLRESLHIENEHIQQTQAHFYQLATDIALLEEATQQRLREKQRLLAEQQQVQVDWQTLSEQVQLDKKALQDCDTTSNETTQHLQIAMKTFTEKQQDFQIIQYQQAVWKAQWDDVQLALANSLRQAQVEEVGLNHLKHRQEEAQARLLTIEEECHKMEADCIAIKPEEEHQIVADLQDVISQEEDNFQSIKILGEELGHQLVTTESQLHQAQDQVHHLKGEQAVLAARLKAVMGQETLDETHPQWANFPRLMDVLSIEKKWQTACEWVLGDDLKAMLVDTIDVVREQRDLAINSAVFTTAQHTKTQTYPSLADKIQGIKPVFSPDLSKIYTAENLTDAWSWLPHIHDDESIITPDCCWLGRGWLRVAGVSQQDEFQCLARLDELNTLDQALLSAEEAVSCLISQRQELSDAVKNNAEQRANALTQLSDTREKMRAHKAAIAHQEQVLQQLDSAKKRLSTERDTLVLRLHSFALDCATHEHSLDTINAVRSEMEAQKSQLMTEQSHWELTVRSSQHATNEAQSAVWQLERQGEREQLLRNQLTQNITRDGTRLSTLEDRLEDIALKCLAQDTPDTSLSERLTEALLKHQETEFTLQQQRQQLQIISSKLSEKEAYIKEQEKKAKALQDGILQRQLELQSVTVRATGMLEALKELNTSIDLLKTLPEDLTATTREQYLLEIVEKIRRLGAINLAAIEEFNTESKRKQYLDEQYNDLTEALTMLDSAIEKMDKETRQKLQYTFNEVNIAFQSLFPRLFGGGRAMLELTCDNLLEAGIVVMAQPPGKRNSTIHLLSGGEKAMTAVALVFAIFQLNPSPFCMLDEVDAPLDDANVGRFCALVKEMSQCVQFLFITHNKVTMELAQHLIGVTMREPGVSRIVSVDVEEALSMAEI